VAQEAAGVEVTDRKPNIGDGRVRRRSVPTVAILGLIAYGIFAAAEPNPNWAKLWCFLTGVFVGQLFPEKWWERRRRRK
jgi:hypothetical protein